MALTVLLGGARSGKSSLAVRAALTQSAPVVFIATAQGLDDEMTDRIRRHQEERPTDWTTVEEPLELAAAIGAAPPQAFVIVDCLTLWVTHAREERGEAWVVEEADRAVEVAAARAGQTVVVSNEVGSGIVPIDAGTRHWRDLLGMVNARFCVAAGGAFLTVAGRVVPLRDADVVAGG